MSFGEITLTLTYAKIGATIFEKHKLKNATTDVEVLVRDDGELPVAFLPQCKPKRCIFGENLKSVPTCSSLAMKMKVR